MSNALTIRKQKVLMLATILCGVFDTALGQIVPPLSVPYIPTTRARPVDAAAAFARADAAGVDVYNQFKRESSQMFADRITAVEMLPIRKKQLNYIYNTVIKFMDKKLQENPASFNNKEIQEQVGGMFGTFMFAPEIIQRFRTEYSRIQAWENFVREKNLLNEPYSNSSGKTEFTNQQALAALYGLDENIFSKIDWK